VGEACCVNKPLECANYLLKCIDKVCTGGTLIGDLAVTLRTNDEDKDADSGIRIAIDGLATWAQSDQIRYDEWSTHTWPLSPPILRLDDLAGRSASICMLPNGDDTWKFNFLLQGNRTDGLKYEIRKENVFLSSDVPCISWDASPQPDPKGTIAAADGKCLTVTNGGALGSVVALNNCVNGTDQQWLLAPTVSAPALNGARLGEIRHSSQCLGLPQGSTANGTLPDLETCDGSLRQQWKWFAVDPAQITGNLGKCLDPNGQGGFLRYQDCDRSPAQVWTVPGCGTFKKTCCDSGMPCQGTLSCQKGTCNSGTSNVNFMTATLDTTNEDKDDNTHLVIAGILSWPGDGNAHYDNWSTHFAPLTPSSIPLANLLKRNLFLQASPNGDDSWKLNFIIHGIRDDGSHFEFRRDNVWLTNEGSPATQIQWSLGPPGLDLVWADTDANGLPLNPTWRGAPGGESCLEDSRVECWDAFKICPYHPTPLESNNLCDPFGHCTGATPNDYGRCSSQSPTYDRSFLCGWHANWFPVTFDGTADSADFSSWPADGDWHIDFSPVHPLANMGRNALLAEFDSDETTENFTESFWRNVNLSNTVHHNPARVIGLMGLDTEHGPPGGHGELHPTYVLQLRLNGSGPPIDRWVLFVRNWGNEGYCGGSQHYLDLQRFTLRFPAPPGAEGATSVKNTDAPDLDAGSENGSNWSGFGVSGLSPVQHDANGAFVEMIFSIGPPEDHTFIDGRVDITWMCGSSACPEPPPPPNTPAPPTSPPAEAQHENDDLLPGADLLTKAQLDELQKQRPSRRRSLSTASRPIQTIPFTASTQQAFNVGQGALTDRTVPDPGRQQRMLDAQKSICKTLANNPQRPAICNSLP
jgi:hypothetical protein